MFIWEDTFWCFSCREFAKTLHRPFTVHYNAYTQSVDVLTNTHNINSMVKDIRHELDIVEEALNQLSKPLRGRGMSWKSVAPS